MLSSDLSVFDQGFPSLDDSWKILILFFVQTCPALLCPMVIVNAGRLGKYLRQKRPKIDKAGVSFEVQRKVEAVLEVRKLATCRTLIDYTSCLTLSFVFFVWIKSAQFGIGAIPAFDLCLMPPSVLWIIFVGLFQAQMMPKSKHMVTVMALSYNILLVYNQILLRWLAVTDRDTLLAVSRFIAGFMFCDHFKAAAFQLIFVVLKAQAPPHASNPDSYNQVWDVLLWELFQNVIFVAPMWLLWFAIEYFVKQFTALMVQKSDVNAALDAARSVLASQCDAEAYLQKDLSFLNPSNKTAHFFGLRCEDLAEKRLTDFLDAADAQRLQHLVADSVQKLSVGATSSASSLTLSFEHSSGRRIETQVYLGTIPGILNEESPCHLIALNAVRADEVMPATELDSPGLPEVQEVKEESSGSEQLPLNANTLAFHSWSQGEKAERPGLDCNIEALQVIVDETLEVREISMKIASRSRSKIFISDCIMPGVWEQLKQTLHDPSAEQPMVVPFIFPKFVSFALAGRNFVMKQVEKRSQRMLSLTLRDLKLRRIPRPSGARTMGRGTTSQVSRCSLDDRHI